jgi:hypothetical protein
MKNRGKFLRRGGAIGWQSARGKAHLATLKDF